MTKKNNSKNHYCIIMAGGIGSRFWPLSKTKNPKQFIDILGIGKSLLQLTYKRNLKICSPENIYIVTHRNYKNLVMEQIPEIPENNILTEPLRRNTAPCIAYATHKIATINPNSVTVVTPSDHLIINETEYTETIISALQASEKNNCLITLGIVPDKPATGYGYIQVNDQLCLNKNENIKKVKTFIEKPELEMANMFINSGDFYWNSGIFIWSVNSIISEFSTYLPDINNIFKAGKGIFNTSAEDNFIDKAYTVCKNISIDYGILEKSKNVYVIGADFGWSDLGTWGALYEQRVKTPEGNVVSGNNVISYSSSNNIVSVPENKLVVIRGLKDYIIAESEDMLLICPFKDEQRIKMIVNDLKAEKGEQYI